ncbi:DUF4302 domain-containing protein [Marinifilum sp. D737]|uniref:DUF4302 domain-containing protein n=1 Tax=Marinifilum sp. D737 TaxID=2969628 RepID=UPI00227297F3|nr:DUF4302 domain-containing protein [Marinifilum sp. D737]MCY1633437.1 DUF4302 domain-containing protein [Marinifilum sp. D737]
MKQKLIYLLILMAGVFNACDNKDTEYIFDKSINERFAELKANYNAKLRAPENGWVGYYNANEKAGAFTLLLKFRDDGTVIMNSDYRGGTTNDTITYKIVKKQDITLVFESWSVLHAIYETNNNDFGGEYVFNISQVKDDEVTLTSKTDNGYGDDEVTELVLKPASVKNWDLSDVYQSEKNLIGGSKSVFRSFKAAETPIAAFTYLASERSAFISYIENDTTKTVTSPLRITPNGFCFIKALTIKGKTLECFTYDTEQEVFVDKTSGVSLGHDLVPKLPLTPYEFGKKGNARYNYLEEGKSSIAFVKFYKEYTASMEKQGITISRVYMRSLNKNVSYFHIYTNLGNVWFDFTYKIKDDGRVYFTLTGDTNAGSLAPLFQPLLDKWLNTNGHYIEGTGGLLNYPNGTFSLINADDPSLKINFYDF